jgi:ATP/maltotriose-dependent transcriptional regulator MalT
MLAELSAREGEVLELVAAGLSNEEIAGGST